MTRETRRWTEAQQKAIMERGRDILVSAAAGSGKTSVLVERIIQRLLDEKEPVDVDRLLVVTFTEAAAGEMKDRIRNALMEIASSDEQNSSLAERQLRLMGSASISTLHSFCLQVVRRYFFLIHLDPRFRVMGEEEAELLQQDVLSDLFEALHQEERDETRELLYHYGGGRDDQTLKHIVRTLHHYLQSLPDGDDWLEQSVEAYEEDSPQWKVKMAAWQESIFDEATALIDNALSALRQATHIASLPAGPGGYIESFDVAKQTIQHVADRISARDWEGTREALNGVTWPRLRSDKDSDGALREEAAKGWNGAKTIINKDVQPLFSTTLDQFTVQVSEGRRFIKEIARVVRLYGQQLQQAKKRAGVVDFSDLERFSLMILELPDSPALKEYNLRFEELFIDEYQDINPVQHRLLTLLSRTEEGDGNRFMVGDVKQSIYRFRLADPRIFLHMQHNFTADGEGGARRIDLSSNFRSHPKILAFVNFIFRQVMHKAVADMEYDAAAELIPGISESGVRPPGGVVELHLVESEPDKTELTDDMASVSGGAMTGIEIEAVTAGQIIRRLIREGFDYGDIAILMRSPKNVAGVVSSQLERMGIPAYSHAGVGFYKAVEVELILSLLRLVDNPRQDIPLAGVLRSPIGRFDERELAEIRRLVPDGPFHDAVFTYIHEQHNPLSEKLRRFLDQIDEWRTMARLIPLSRLIQRLYEETGYADFVAGLSGGPRKEANLQALYEHALAFDREATRGLERFIDYVDQLDEAGKEVAPPPSLGEGENVVSIMSVHKSKGLEFPVVIVLNPDRSWNKLDTQGDVLFEKDLGIAAAVVDRDRRIRYPSIPYRAVVTKIRQQNLAEEMRLLYVALTRAQDRLIVVSAVKDIESRAARWSEVTRETGWRLPVGYVAKARSWLDWIALAVVRHAEGEKLREVGAGELGGRFYNPADPHVLQNELSVSVNLWMDGPPGDVLVSSDSKDEVDGNEQGVDFPGLSDTQEEQIRGQLDALHNWTYPFERDTLLPAKVSVTELSRRGDPDDDLTDELDETSAAMVIPRLGVKSDGNGQPKKVNRGVDPIIKGISTHRFLSKVDLTGQVDAIGLRRQLTRLQSGGLMSQEEANAIDIERIARFFRSTLGQELIQSAQPGSTSRVWRELPFTMRLGEEATVIQGTIDCLFQNDGKYTLIDYKTDRIRAGEEEEVAKLKYSRQVGYYHDFVSAVTDHAPIRAYLVFLQTGGVVEMEVAT